MDTTTYFGLSASEIKKSEEKYGTNIFEEEKKKSFFMLFLSGFRDPIVEILLVALLINLVFSFQTFRWYETLGIVIAVIVSTLVSTLSEKGSEKAFDKMRQASEKNLVTIIRNGKIEKLPETKIVVGDIVILTSGSIIPADGRILDGEISVNQAALSGESKEIKKYPVRNEKCDLLSKSHVFRGTAVTSGKAIIEVTHVGTSTLYGKIAVSVKEEKTESPLKKRLSVLAKQISKIGYFSAFCVGIISLFNSFVIKAGFDTAKMQSLFFDPRYVFSSILSAFALGITVVVVAVPEGLPMMISVVLSANMKKMMKENILVRKPVGIETSGSMTFLFTDKTGTITTGKEELCEIVFKDGESPVGKELRSSKLFMKFADAVLSTSECLIIKNKVTGSNSTDRALTEACKGIELSKKTIVSKTPFDSKLKYSKTVFSDGSGYIKGAPEKLIDSCIGFYSKNGKIIFGNIKNRLNELFTEKAASGKRVVFVGETTPDGKYIFIGFGIISDKERKDAPASVAALRNAGINVVMITGDGKETACKIAENVGILKKGELAFSGDEIRKFSDSEIKKNLEKIKVIYRLLPEDKKRLILLAKKSGHIVGMTGDGINDAPALKQSDIGFAMNSGTDVAKEASDIILKDNSLLSVTKAVLYGRTVFKSIRKFIVFQLSMNFIAVGITSIAPFFGIPNPISIMQMLWINLIMDTLGGLAFAGEAPKKEYMKEKPKSPKEKIMTQRMVSEIACMSIFSVIYLLAFLLLPFSRNKFLFYQSRPYFMTVFFSLFIFTSVLISFNVRTERLNIFSGLLKNRAFCLVMLFVVTVQILIIYFGGKVFSTEPISQKDIVMSFFLSLPVILVESVRKIRLKKAKKLL